MYLFNEIVFASKTLGMRLQVKIEKDTFVIWIVYFKLFLKTIP